MNSLRLAVLAAAPLLSIALCTPAEARRISIDFGDGGFDSSGTNFTLANSFELDRRNDGTCDTPCTGIDVGFDLDFGTGATYSSLFVSENGIVSFGSALAAGSFTSAASLGALGAPVIATYYADLVSAAPSGELLDLTPGTIVASRGVADPLADALGAFSTTEAVNAFRLTWLGGTLASDPATRIYTQLLLYSAGGSGDFDLRLSYGFFSDVPVPANGSLAGFSLGTNAVALTGPYSPTTDYFYSFRNGALVTNGGGNGGGAPAPVPEPATAALLLLGLAGVGWARRRR